MLHNGVGSDDSQDKLMKIFSSNLVTQSALSHTLHRHPILSPLSCVFPERTHPATGHKGAELSTLLGHWLPDMTQTPGQVSLMLPWPASKHLASFQSFLSLQEKEKAFSSTHTRTDVRTLRKRERTALTLEKVKGIWAFIPRMPGQQQVHRPPPVCLLGSILAKRIKSILTASSTHTLVHCYK